jgi:Trypsin-like peptidase domain/CHAT domain
MGKLAVLEIGEGDFEQGFQVTIRIGEDGRHLSCDARGNLPQNLEILDIYRQWQECYNQFHRPNYYNKSHQHDSQRSRLKPETKTPSNMALSDVNAKSDELKKKLNQWLDSPEFGKVREIIRQELERSEQIRVIVRTDREDLYQLPWHLWEVFDHYTYADVVFCPKVNNSSVLEYKSPTSPNKIKILAAFGHLDKGGVLKLDIEKDLELLKKHLSANNEFIEIVIVPITISTARNLASKLREEKADIFYYAGHSSSEADGKVAEIDMINIRTLGKAFKAAAKEGLKLAIFNSCQGLGIANKLLTESQIPHVVVMREAIKDEVCHDFLNSFLQEFTKGSPLHLALRTAREKLHDLEEEYPSASLLPVIFQHSIEVPDYWHIFTPKVRSKRSFGKLFMGVAGLMMLGAITIGVMAFRNHVTLDRTAKNNTVLIKGKNHGSGVLFAKRNNTYYVLTAKSVVNPKDKYKIVTVDKKETDAVISNTINKQLSGIDLVILEFNSNERYNIARLGNYDTSSEGTTFFISGWSAIDGNKEPSYHFSEGKIVSLPGGLPNGYTLIYGSNTREGMIGGPLIDTHGCVIGIHGREETEAIRNLESAEIGRVKNGFGRGIPMEKILQQISDRKLEKDLGRMDKDCK